MVSQEPGSRRSFPHALYTDSRIAAQAGVRSRESDNIRVHEPNVQITHSCSFQEEARQTVFGSSYHGR